MRAYVIETGTVIEPFGDRVPETLILDRPFRQVQSEALQACGFTVERIESRRQLPETEAGPFLVLTDHLYFTPALLQDFLRRCRQAGKSGTFQLFVRKGLFTRLLATLQEVSQNERHLAFPLWYVAQGPLRQEEATEIELDVDEESYEGSFPKHMIGKETYRFSVTSRPITQITNALHLALANLAANFARLADLKKMSLVGKISTLLKARSVNKFRVLQAVSVIHPEAEVHPTAVIEGSVIGRGAKIGAHAVIKCSYIGDNAFIDDQAGVKFSIVGRGAYVANNCVLFFTTAYPEAFLISGPYQFSLFGYESAMMNSIPSDYRMDGSTISVPTAAGVVDSGLRFVGSVIGHRTKIAAGVIIAPGRIIPNDLFIFPDPARVITKVPPTLEPGSTVFLIDGKLVPAPRKKE